jgi:hypothetical protein
MTRCWLKYQRKRSLILGANLITNLNSVGHCNLCRSRPSVFRQIVSACFTGVLVPASSSMILARNKLHWFIAQRVTPGHLGLLCRVLFNRRLDCGLVGSCGRRSGYSCCRFISCRGNLRPGRNSFFRPRCRTRPRLVWDLS